MFPIVSTSDTMMEKLSKRLKEKDPSFPELNLQELRSAVTVFSRFINNKIATCEETFFRIKNFGDYRLSPYELCRNLKRVRTILDRVERNIDNRGTTIKQYKLEEYLEKEEKYTHHLSVFSRIYGRSYMEFKFKYFKELNIPEHPQPKEELIKNKKHFFDFTKKEFIWYSEEELEKIKNED